MKGNLDRQTDRQQYRQMKGNLDIKTLMELTCRGARYIDRQTAMKYRQTDSSEIERDSDIDRQIAVR